MQKLLLLLFISITLFIAGCNKDKATTAMNTVVNQAQTPKVETTTYDAQPFYDEQTQAAQECSDAPVTELENPPSSGDSGSSTTTTTCEAYNAIIYAGQFYDAGNVKITNTQSNLTIDVNSLITQGWHIKAYHIYVGSTAVPTNPAGNPANGQFPYTQEFNELQTGFTLTIPFSELSAACGSKLYVAIHTEMVKLDSAGAVVQTETGWASGPYRFNSGWSQWAYYDICCEEGGGGAGNTGCTYSQGFWKNHNKYGKNASQKLDWPISEDTLLCNQTWLNILKTPPAGGNVWYILAHQWIAAKLNQATGASTGAMVDHALNHGEAIMTGNCTIIPSEMQSITREYAELLDNYNNGFTGPGHCSKTEK